MPLASTRVVQRSPGTGSAYTSPPVAPAGLVGTISGSPSGRAETRPGERPRILGPTSTVAGGAFPPTFPTKGTGGTFTRTPPAGGGGPSFSVPFSPPPPDGSHWR